MQGPVALERVVGDLFHEVLVGGRKVAGHKVTGHEVTGHKVTGHIRSWGGGPNGVFIFIFYFKFWYPPPIFHATNVTL